MSEAGVASHLLLKVYSEDVNSLAEKSRGLVRQSSATGGIISTVNAETEPGGAQYNVVARQHKIFSQEKTVCPSQKILQNFRFFR